MNWNTSLKFTGVIIFFILTVLVSGPVSNAQNAISLNKDGWVYYKKTEYDRALFCFTNSLRLNGRYYDSMVGAGKSYYALGVFDRALEMFSDTLKYDAKSVDSLNGIGMVLTETGRFTDAIGYFEKAFSISADSIDSEYGIAYVYYKMDKRLWAKRKLENIFKSNPYHFQSLLLMADIKTDEGRLREARTYVEKAIDSATENPEGHIRYGNILLKKYLKTGDADSLDEARTSYGRALSINPDNFRANMNMGLITLMEIEDYNFNKALSGGGGADVLKSKTDAAISYINKAVQVNKTRSALYTLSLAYDMSGDKTRALEHMLAAYAKYPSDALLKGKLEDFLVLNEYKSGHPARVMLSGENIELAKLNRRDSLHANVIYYLRRSLLMNPLNKDVREQLINYYSILDYNKLMIDEMKNVLMQYPEFRYQDALNLAIIKRRDRLYVREGYAGDDTPRDVPYVLVLNFNSAGRITDHPDAGKIAARNLTFALQQFGRMKTPGLKDREQIAGNLKTDGENLYSTIKKIKQVSDKNELKIDYLIFGEISEVDDYISLNIRIMDLARGYIIYEMNESKKGRENLNLLSLLAAEKIYNIIPYSGKVLKVKENGIILNLGLFDGVKEGAELVIYRGASSRINNETIRYAEIFTVKETDTFICYAEPDRPAILRDIDSTNVVYPLMKRRARKLE